ncbi:MAG: Transcriptional regulator, LysR family protein [Myxococcales bacterium]|nr:Transcriptional regulator, LysR family protein [Myxococcales bacterium]
MLDDVQEMVVFVRVVDAGSFTAAARALETTTSTISKRIARLEESLGVRLLQRTTRRVTLTEAGRALYDQCARILRDLEEAKRSVADLGAAPRGLLRVLADEVLADRALAPLMATFLSKYPELRLDLVAGNLDDVDLVEQGFDVAVQIGVARANSSMLIRRVGTVDTVVCAAPSYLAAAGAPTTPDALARHECLHLGGRTLSREWTLRVASGPAVAPTSSRAQMSSVAALREAAVAGLGLVHLPRIAVADELRDGRLLSVLEDYVWRDLSVQTLLPAGGRRAPKTAVFVELLTRELPDRLRTPVANSSTFAMR